MKFMPILKGERVEGFLLGGGGGGSRRCGPSLLEKILFPIQIAPSKWLDPF